MSCVHVAVFSDEEKPQNHSQWSVSCYLQVTIVLVWTLLIWWIVLWAQQCGDGSKVTASREVMIQTSLWVIKSVAPGCYSHSPYVFMWIHPVFWFSIFYQSIPDTNIMVTDYCSGNKAWAGLITVSRPRQASCLPAAAQGGFDFVWGV